MSETFYTSAIQWGNSILVRGVRNGQRFSTREKFSPTLYVRSKTETKTKTLHGESLESLDFTDIKEAKEFLERYREVKNFPIYGNASFQYQYISKTYPNIIEPQFHLIDIVAIDIEVASENGFPDPQVAQEEILLITIQDKASKKKVTFGTRPYDITRAKDIKTEGYEYVLCKDEVHLLQSFLAFWEANTPDIITGWYVQYFDIPYLVNRISKLLGGKDVERLSPWKNVLERFISVNNRELQTYDIQGVSTLDYIDLYKKFVQERRESYTLKYIARVELGRTKLDNPYDTMREFYTKDFQGFVEYNVVDVELIDELEAKMGFIELIVTMAYDAHCNYADAFSPVRMWDCIIYNYLLDHGIQPPQPQEHVGRGIEGAYVLNPNPGRYHDIVSFDATSMYPRLFMEYNMSPETVVGVKPNITVEVLMDRAYSIGELREQNVSLAANGAMFSRSKRGILPSVVHKVFEERLYYKKKQLAAEAEFEKKHDKKLAIDISRYKNIQKAKKTQLVSLYGATANKYFRYYDDRIAEAITLTGQFYIRSVSKALDGYLLDTHRKLLKTPDAGCTRWVFYNDTDSCYVSLKPLMDVLFSVRNKPTDFYISAMDDICQKKLSPVITKECRKLAQDTNAFESQFEFKREILADVGLWTVKKRYAVQVWDKEGIRYLTPVLKVTGLETQRSSTPEVVRAKLKAILNICLTGTEEQLQNYIAEFEREFRTLPPEAIAFPRSVNGLSKYGSPATIYTKGTPMHVRASLLYNHWIRLKELDKLHEKIQEGDKIKFLYLREPNTIGENCFAFPIRLPKELDIHRYIDYTTQFQKTFVDPIVNIVSCLNWSVTPQASLASLFGD